MNFLALLIVFVECWWKSEPRRVHGRLSRSWRVQQNAGAQGKTVLNITFKTAKTAEERYKQLNKQHTEV